MRKVDLRRVDLNLLVALDALLEERSVTRASLRLGLSQPAMSRALARLRALFSDTLLVDGSRGYMLSGRAEELRPLLRQTLAGIGAMLDASPFDPSQASGSVRLVMTDLHAAVLAPRLLAQLYKEAPGVNLDILPPTPEILEMLGDDRTDAIVGAIEDAPSGIHRRKLFDDRYVTLMRTGHPAASRNLTLEAYLALDHMVVSITGTGAAPIDVLLSGMGRSRKVKVRVPNFFAAMEIAASSDLVMTLPESLAHMAAGGARLVVLPPPVDPGNIALNLLWHARYQDAPRHVWLRNLIVAVVQPPRK